MSNSKIRRTMSTITLGLMLLVMFSAPPALAEDDGGPTAMDRAFDAMVLRPLGAVGVVMGAAVMIPAAFFTAPGGKESIDNAYDVFVRTPLDNLINAPLGRDFGS